MEKIVVGMSGGVDSSVAAWLLAREGYEVVGVTMLVGDGVPDGTAGPAEGSAREMAGGSAENAASAANAVPEQSSAAEDAKRVADIIGIPHCTVDFRETFRREVEEPFVSDYLNGRTPNPCVVCNRRVKWEALLGWAGEIGADGVATGHYARIRRLGNGRFALCRAVSAARDQTYALYALTQEQLARTRMPLGEYGKPRIRQIAEEAGLPVSRKPDSQEICFIPDHDYAAFVHNYAGLTPPPGNFVDRDGRILGRHRGITHYTVGQRKGLGVTFGKPMFVLEIRPETNEVVLGEEPEVWGDHLLCGGLNFQSIPELTGEMRVTAKIRYSHAGASCRLRRVGDDLAVCDFDAPVRAITPGQAVVFYDGDLVVGGGTILSGARA